MMLTLMDTAIGFIVVLLMISLVIKGLTSVIKNFVDYKRAIIADQIRKFVERADAQSEHWRKLLKGLYQEGRMGGEARDPRLSHSLNKAIGDGGLRSWLAAGETPGEKAQDILPLVQTLNDQIGEAVSATNKNFSLLIGLALCLLLNINALTVWTSLYHDANLRAQFSAPAMIQSVSGAATESKETAAVATSQAVGMAQAREYIASLKRDIPFAMGKIWTGEVKGARAVAYEFVGSLLTGLLASVGAPYLHDMLRTLTALRRRAEAAGGRDGQEAGA